jgi:hypothetical protein
VTENEAIHFNVDLRALVGRVQNRLIVTNRMMSIGLNAPISPSHEIPGVNLQMSFGVPKWTPGQTAEGWKIWMLRNGFRDVAEGIAALLDEVQSTLSIWDLFVVQRERTVKGDDLNKIIIRTGKAFHRSGLPDKIETLKSLYHFILEPEYQRDILSINKARNCLVHRGGLVSTLDTGKDPHLTVSWTTLATIAISDENGKETEVVSGQVVEGPAKIAMRHVKREKTFAVGQHLSFSANEFSEICVCVFRLALWCSEHLENYARAKGFTFDNDAAKAGGTETAALAYLEGKMYPAVP